MKSILKSLVLAVFVFASGRVLAYGTVDTTIDGISYHLIWNNDDNYGNEAILISPQVPLRNCEIATVKYTPAGETQSRTFPVTEIHSAAFGGGLASGKLSFPNVKTVCADAFADCLGLSEISLGAATMIENRTFDGCTSLSKITLGGVTAPSLGSDVFREVPSDATVYVHALAQGFPGQDETWNGLKVAYIEGRIENYYGVRVNGLDIGFGSGDGWNFSSDAINLTGVGPFVLSGTNAADNVHIVQGASATVTLDNLVVTSSVTRCSTYKVDKNVAATILLKGTNDIVCTSSGEMGNQAGIFVPRGASLTIDAAKGCSLTEARLNVSGGKDGAAIGGGSVSSVGRIVINGGSIYATGGEGEVAIGGGCPVSGEIDGEIEINGGYIYVETEKGVPAVGSTCYSQNRESSGLGYSIKIAGGTVNATQHAAWGIIDTGKKGKCVLITGGSIAGRVSNPVNAAGEPLYSVWVGSFEKRAPVTLVGLDDYGTKDLVPILTCVYVWLPNGARTFTANGIGFYAKVEGESTIARETTWTLGKGVTGAWVDGVVTIVGAGPIDDFADEYDVPWYGLDVTAISLPATVTPGQNFVTGLADTVTVNGVTLALMRQLVGGDAIIGGLTPAGATAIAVKDGKVKLTVQVETTTDLGEGAEWQPATVEGGELTKDGDGVVLTLPAAAKKGFYILKTK